MKFCEAGPYTTGYDPLIITIGGGITTENLFYALTTFYFGGVYVHPSITARQLSAGDGPTRLVVSERYAFSPSGAGRRPNSAQIPTLGEVLQRIGTQLASWETALRTFLTNPRGFLREPQPLLLWLDTQSQGDPVDAIYVRNDIGDPMFNVWKLRRSDPFPDVQFFSERSLEMVPTGNLYGP